MNSCCCPQIQVMLPGKFPPKEWHDWNEHYSFRVKMIKNIISLLTARSTLRRSPSPEFLMKVPNMSMRLENALYHEAPTFGEYYEIETLKVRLQQLALAMGNKSN